VGFTILKVVNWHFDFDHLFVHKWVVLSKTFDSLQVDSSEAEKEQDECECLKETTEASWSIGALLAICISCIG
jgi:hypothetical protein